MVFIKSLQTKKRKWVTDASGYFMLLGIIRAFVHIILPTRRPLFRYLKSISPNYKNLDVIEIGSGDSGKNFSAMHILKIQKLFCKQILIKIMDTNIWILQKI